MASGSRRRGVTSKPTMGRSARSGRTPADLVRRLEAAQDRLVARLVARRWPRQRHGRFRYRPHRRGRCAGTGRTGHRPEQGRELGQPDLRGGVPVERVAALGRRPAGPLAAGPHPAPGEILHLRPVAGARQETLVEGDRDQGAREQGRDMAVEARPQGGLALLRVEAGEQAREALRREGRSRLSSPPSIGRGAGPRRGPARPAARPRRHPACARAPGCRLGLALSARATTSVPGIRAGLRRACRTRTCCGGVVDRGVVGRDLRQRTLPASGAPSPARRSVASATSRRG